MTAFFTTVPVRASVLIVGTSPDNVPGVQTGVAAAYDKKTGAVAALPLPEVRGSRILEAPIIELPLGANRSTKSGAFAALRTFRLCGCAVATTKGFRADPEPTLPPSDSRKLSEPPDAADLREPAERREARLDAREPSEVGRKLSRLCREERTLPREETERRAVAVHSSERRACSSVAASAPAAAAVPPRGIELRRFAFNSATAFLLLGS